MFNIVFTLFSSYYDNYCELKWSLQDVIKAHKISKYAKVHTNESISSFSSAIIENYISNNAKKNKSRKKNIFLHVSKNTVTPVGILDSILWPKTYIGYTILCLCIKNESTLQELRESQSIRSTILQIISCTINYFPSYLLNTEIPINCYLKRYWNTWLKVDNDVDKIFSKNLNLQCKVGLKRRKNGTFKKTKKKF